MSDLKFENEFRKILSFQGREGQGSWGGLKEVSDGSKGHEASSQCPRRVLETFRGLKNCISYHTLLPYRDACSIPDPETETVVVTGGQTALKTVSRYGKEGWKEDLPELQNGRFGHGCTSFMSKAIERVKDLYYFDKLSFLAAKHGSTSALVFCLSIVKP